MKKFLYLWYLGKRGFIQQVGLLQQGEDAHLQCVMTAFQGKLLFQCDSDSSTPTHTVTSQQDPKGLGVEI